MPTPFQLLRGEDKLHEFGPRKISTSLTGLRGIVAVSNWRHFVGNFHSLARPTKLRLIKRLALA